MAIQIQLPGYNHAAPGVALADIINSGANVYKSIKQGNLESKQAESQELKNQAQTNEMAYQKKLADPTTAESEEARNSLLANATLQKAFGKHSGLSDQELSPLDQVIDIAKNGRLVGTQAPPDGQEGPASPLRQAISGLEAERMADKSQFKQLGGVYESKLKGDANITGAQIRSAPQNDRNANTISGQYSHDFGPMDGTIQAANRVGGIIKRIQNGELKSTPTLTTDLSNALGQMFNNGKAATVSGSEHAVAGMTSLEGNAASKYGFVSGQPMNTVTPEQLSQLNADVNALRGEYVSARKNAFDSWIEGIPQSERAALTARFNKLSSTSAAPAKEGYVPSKDEAIAEAKKRGLIK